MNMYCDRTLGINLLAIKKGDKLDDLTMNANEKAIS